jgi:hypothetical protein
MGSPPISISDSLADAEWETLAYALSKMNSGIEGNDAASRKLRAQLGLIRMLMYEEIRHWNGSGTIDLSFLMASIKTMRTVERLYEGRKARDTQFLTFLKLLIYKFEKQKIKVKKPLAERGEFGRMKGVVENGHGII